MGAGKSTIGREVAERTARPFVDTDAEIERLHGPIPELFERGEPEFRRLEEQIVAEALAGPPSVIALGGGAVLSEKTRERLRAHAFTVLLDVDVDDAWERVKGSNRPLARREEDFRRAIRRAKAGLHRGNGCAGGRRGERRPCRAPHLRRDRDFGTGVVTSSSTNGCSGLHPLEGRDRVLTVPPGEEAKSLAVVERIWRELELDRDGMLIACGGGSTTDVAGFAAATYKRGVKWTAIPTTLTGHGRCGDRREDRHQHRERERTLRASSTSRRSSFIDTRFLATLPDAERRAGMAEVVKTGLLAGREVWKLEEEEMIRACAAFKAGVVLSDPFEREGRRTILNLGHTFAHALETGSGYTVSHGDAVALGLLAALRLSGLDTGVVEEILRPEPVAADPDAAWASLKRDKKGEGVFVLLEAPGKPVVTTLPDAAAREALEALIRK